MSLGRVLTILLYLALAFSAATSTATAQVVGYLPAFHPRYKHIVTIPGAILDVKGDTILFAGPDNVVASYNLASLTTTAFYTNAFGMPPAFVTPTGVFILADQALQIDGAEQIPLGGYNSWAFPDFRDHLVDGSFGILRTTNGLFLRDFTARTNCIISTTFGFTDVAPNGAVVFTTAIDETNKAVRWFQNGETTTLAVVPMYEYPYVATDGTNVLWSEHHAPLGQQYPFGSIYLQTGSGEKIEIATNTSVFSYQSVRGEMPRYSPAAVKNGWVIFPRDPLTKMNLWRRAPDGSITQLTTAPAAPVAMRDDGNALISDGYSIYYCPTTAPQKLISDDFPLAKYYASGNKFYAYGWSAAYIGEGTAVYEIEVEQDPFGIVYPAYNPETQIFSFGLIPGALGDYELQRSTDFIVWSSVATITATTGYPFEVQATTPPGYFRVHKL